jgi:hypothetical protein
MKNKKIFSICFILLFALIAKGHILFDRSDILNFGGYVATGNIFPCDNNSDSATIVVGGKLIKGGVSDSLDTVGVVSIKLFMKGVLKKQESTTLAFSGDTAVFKATFRIHSEIDINANDSRIEVYAGHFLSAKATNIRCARDAILQGGQSNGLVGGGARVRMQDSLHRPVFLYDWHFGGRPIEAFFPGNSYQGIHHYDSMSTWLKRTGWDKYVKISVWYQGENNAFYKPLHERVRLKYFQCPVIGFLD